MLGGQVGRHACVCECMCEGKSVWFVVGGFEQ